MRHVDPSVYTDQIFNRIKFMESLLFLPIEQLTKKLSNKEITSEALTRGYLERIEKFNPALNAYVEVYEDFALAQAMNSDQRRAAGYTLGPLDGIPIAVKDLCEMAGRKTTVGSKPWKDKLSTQTATAVTKLLAAGAVILGKTQMVEYAFGTWGTNPFLGTPKNPWDMTTHRVPGGSSSGSAVAVAAGLAAAAIGSDTGGSIRIPASLNGITGLKTTTGLISLFGCADLSQALDTLGPMTRSAWDAGLLTQIMSGYDEADARTHNAPRAKIDLSAPYDDDSLAGVVIALIPPESYPTEIAPAVREAFNNTVNVFAELGATILEQKFPFDFQEMMLLNGQIVAAEAYAIHHDYIKDMKLEIGAGVRHRVLSGESISAASYIHSMNKHKQARKDWARWMANTDALLIPGTPITACPVTEVDETKTPLAAFTRSGNFMGSCGLAIPAGFDENDLPIGMQLYGKAFDEAKLIKLGRAFQKATDWHLKFPAL
jgi:aspartyl-tRNA(Asn)/glutamyl-tRNA(Gln) amidotransferase subunit A